MKHVSTSFVICGAATLLAGLVYLNALHNPFVYDDYHTVVANPSIQDLRNVRALLLGDVSRPVINTSYAIDRAVWGTTPFGFHLTSVLLHMLNVVLLWHVARRLADGRIVAISAAALFAVHPMMTEAVGYVSGRSELLCATWFLAALLCGSRWLIGGGPRWGALTVVCWVFALASKETAAMFPFVFAAYDALAFPGGGQEQRRRLLTMHLPLISFAVVAGVARLLVLALIEYPGQIAVHWNYILLDLDVARRYLGLMFVPNHQTIFHSVPGITGVFDPRALMAIGVAGVAAVIAWELRRENWLVSFGICWFLLSLVPSATLIALDQGEPMSEHRIYLASCGLFLAVGAAGAWLWDRVPDASATLRGSMAAAFAIVVAALAAETVMRNAVWSDPVRLWSESVDLAPDHYRPRLLLGEALHDAGKRQEALEQFQAAIRLRPKDPTGYMKLGLSLAAAGRVADARVYLLKALEIDPRNAAARQALTMLNAAQSGPGTNGDRR